ncbi:MAG: 2-C-methyl-D-erythritol 4-phosphate cytidylyltransferase [Candidatus Binataceae bacterium]
MQAAAIIVAAGSGTRLGSPLPKAFVCVAGRTMLSYSLRTIAAVPAVMELIVMVPAGMETVARAEVTSADPQLPVILAAGGIERQDSVRIALGLTSSEADLVIVHDAARPFAPLVLFQRCIDRAAQDGAAIAAIPLADTLKRVDERGRIGATVPRAGLWQAQTPQVFARKLIVAAHDYALGRGIKATDDADLVEQMGQTVEVVEGSPMNLKITAPDDLALAEALAARLFPH